MKNLICVNLICVLISCNKQQQENLLIRYDLSQSIRLSEPEVIYSFNDRYPAWIMAKDSIAIIVEVKNSSSLIALNVNTKKVLKYFGNHGSGPEDVIDPVFMPMSSTDDFIFFNDINAGKIMKIHLKGEERFKIEKVERVKGYGDQLNISSNFAVYRTAYLEGKNMFYIYNQTNDSITGVDYYPDVKGIFAINSLLAPRLALNEPKNRIIAGMYYIDMFSVFDLTGKRLKSVHFSDDYIPPVNEESFDLQKGYSGINIYPANDLCYLLRQTRVDGEVKDIYLILSDWNGNPIKSYLVPDNDIAGGFCIDEKNKKMYAIRHSIINNEDEIFYLVAYSLDI